MWILSTAIKAPSTPPNTVSQVPKVTASSSSVVGGASSKAGLVELLMVVVRIGPA